MRSHREISCAKNRDLMTQLAVLPCLRLRQVPVSRSIEIKKKPRDTCGPRPSPDTGICTLRRLGTGVRAVEGAALEMLYTGNRIGSSNLPQSVQVIRVS